MPMFKLNRDKVHSSVYGHTVEFKKDQPVYVPPVPALIDEVMLFGAESVDGEFAVAEQADLVEKPPVGDDRAVLIAAAIEQIVEKNDSDDFTGSGVPTTKSIEAIVKFDLSAAERDAAWDAYKAAA